MYQLSVFVVTFLLTVADNFVCWNIVAAAVVSLSLVGTSYVLVRNKVAEWNSTKKSVNPWYSWLLGVGLQVRV